jgi:hypothetical protein
MAFRPGIYRLHARADDGVRVYVDGKLVLDEWHTASGEEVYAVDLPLRDRHLLVVEYYERGGRALVKFWWQRIGDLPTPVPPTPTPTPTVNRAPVAVDDAAIIAEDTSVSINVLANDSDPDGDALTISGYDRVSAQGGGVSCTSAGMCTYDPPTNFNGHDTFNYTVSDGTGHSDTGNVTVMVNPVNDPPVAVDDSAETDMDTSVSINVLANDSDPDGDTLTVSDYETASAQGGMVQCTDAGMCTYSPPAGVAGTDTFGYTISDGKGGSASATVTVTVNLQALEERAVIGLPRD